MPLISHVTAHGRLTGHNEGYKEDHMGRALAQLRGPEFEPPVRFNVVEHVCNPRGPTSKMRDRRILKAHGPPSLHSSEQRDPVSTRWEGAGEQCWGSSTVRHVCAEANVHLRWCTTTPRTHPGGGVGAEGLKLYFQTTGLKWCLWENRKQIK